MKYVISAKGNDLNAQVDPRFGRAEKLIIYNSDDKNFKVIDNSASRSQAHGSGINTAQTVLDEGIKVAISGDFGPKVFDVLSKAGIVMHKFSNGTVEQAIKDYEGSKSL